MNTRSSLERETSYSNLNIIYFPVEKIHTNMIYGLSPLAMATQYSILHVKESFLLSDDSDLLIQAIYIYIYIYITRERWFLLAISQAHR